MAIATPMASVSASDSAEKVVPATTGMVSPGPSRVIWSARAVRGPAYAESVAETSSRTTLPDSNVHVAAGRAMSTVVGFPGVVGTVTGATRRRGNVGTPPVTCHRLRNRVADVAVEVMVSRTRGAPTTDVRAVSGGESNAADCPGRAASGYVGRFAPRAPVAAPPGMPVIDAGSPPGGVRTGRGAPASSGIVAVVDEPT